MISAQSCRLSSNVNLTADNATNNNLIIPKAKGLSNVVTERGSLGLCSALMISTLLILAYACYNGVVYGGVDKGMLVTYSACITAVAIYPCYFLLQRLRRTFFPSNVKKTIKKNRPKNKAEKFWSVPTYSAKVPVRKSKFMQVVGLPPILLYMLPFTCLLISSIYAPSISTLTLTVFFGVAVIGDIDDYLLFNHTVKRVPDNADLYYNSTLSYWKCDTEAKFSNQDNTIQTVITVLIFVGLVLLYFQSFWCLIPFYASVFISTLCNGRIYTLLRWASLAGILDAVLVMTNFFA